MILVKSYLWFNTLLLEFLYNFWKIRTFSPQKNVIGHNVRFTIRACVDKGTCALFKCLNSVCDLYCRFLLIYILFLIRLLHCYIRVFIDFYFYHRASRKYNWREIPPCFSAESGRRKPRSRKPGTCISNFNSLYIAYQYLHKSRVIFMCDYRYDFIYNY